MSEFKAESQPGGGVTRAVAHLPALDIEVAHYGPVAGEGEQISIHLRATPSFEAFGRYLEAANPFAFWAAASRMAWLPWFEAMRLALQPFASSGSLRTPEVEAPPLVRE